MSKVTEKAMFHHFLTMKYNEILVISIVISHIDYTNYILYGFQNLELQKMHSENVCKTSSPKESSTQALKEQH